MELYSNLLDFKTAGISDFNNISNRLYEISRELQTPYPTVLVEIQMWLSGESMHMKEIVLCTIVDILKVKYPLRFIFSHHYTAVQFLAY